jgi:hypothetical protein
VKPILQALVLADHIYQDRVTGKMVICGTFNAVKFSRTPPVVDVQCADGTRQKCLLGGMHSGSPYAYVNLTDVSEGTKLALQFVNLTKNEVLFGTEVAIGKVNRLAAVEMMFPLPPLPIGGVGTYAVEVVCEGEILGSWRIVATDLGEEKKEEESKNDDT